MQKERHYGLYLWICNFVFFLLLSNNIFTAEEKKIPVECSGDYLEYDELNNAIFAKGNVKVKYKDIVVTADEVHFNSKTSDISASGNISVTEKDSVVTGISVKLNLKSKVGVIEDIELLKKPWYFKGENIEKKDEKNIYINSGFATTCSQKKHPHYKLVSKQIRVELDEKVESWHMLLYVGDIPVFYFPYFYRSLKSTMSPISIKPGYTTTEGFYLKGSYNYEFSESVYGSLLLDYLTNKGFGYGLRQSYRFKEPDYQGYLYTYYIEEKDTGRARWRIDWDHKNQITDKIFLTGRINYLSDQSITRDLYVDYYPVYLRELRSFLAVTQYSPDYTLIVSAEEQDSWNDIEKKFYKNLVYLPSIRFQSSSLKIPDTAFYYSIGAEFSNYYQRNITIPSNSYFNMRLALTPSLSYSLLMFSNNTLNASITFRGSWQNLPDYGFTNNGFNSSYSTSINWHSIWNEYWDSDLTHSFSQRLTNVNNDIYDGIDMNKLFGRTTFRFRGFTTTTTTGYDLRSLDPEFKNKLDNIVNSTRIVWSGDSDTYFNTQYNIRMQKIGSIDTLTSFGRTQAFTFGLGLNFIDNSPYINTVDLSGSLGTNIGDDIRIELGARYDTVNGRFKEQRAKFLTNITDCWYANVSLLKSWDTISFNFILQLRAFKESEIDRKTTPEVFKY